MLVALLVALMVGGGGGRDGVGSQGYGTSPDDWDVVFLQV